MMPLESRTTSDDTIDMPATVSKNVVADLARQYVDAVARCAERHKEAQLADKAWRIESDGVTTSVRSFLLRSQQMG